MTAAMFGLVVLISGCETKRVQVPADTQRQIVTIPSPVLDGDRTDSEIIVLPAESTDVTAEEITHITTVYFDFDSSILDDENYQKVIQNSRLLRQKDGLKIQVEGNCDAWGTGEYNMALGLRRARTVKDILVNEGVDEVNIVLKSYGELNPVCSDNTAACFARNRRVDFTLVKPENRY